MARLRGARFAPDATGYFHVAYATYALAMVALDDVMAATGFAGMTRETYVRTVAAERSAFLRRLPGVTL